MLELAEPEGQNHHGRQERWTVTQYDERRQGKGRHDDNVCGPDCRYRALYEGSQATLRDMASHQADALGRHGRLKQAVVDTLKAEAPGAFQEAELRIGGRLQSADDPTVIAYLRYLTHRLGTDGSGRGQVELRQVLERAGFVLPETGDLSAWAETIERQRIAGAEVASTREAERPENRPVPVAAPTAVDGGRVEVRRTLAGIAPTMATAGVATAVANGGGETGEGLSSDRTTSRSEMSGGYAGPRSGGEPVLENLAGLFADSGPMTSEPQETDDDNISVPQDQQDQQGQQEQQGQQPGSDDEMEEDENRTGEAFEESLDDENRTGEDEHDDAEPETVRAVSAPRARKGRSNQSPLRPTLFPTTAKPKGRRGGARTSRVSALPPDPGPYDVPPEGDLVVPVDLDAATRAQLEALVVLGRPIFTSDLAAAIGDTDAVAAWEQHELSSGGSQVRFIFSKPRYRLRGSLVIPHGAELRAVADENDRHGWWSECRKRFRGRALYELAVLLHRVGDQIVAHRIEQNALLLRLRQPRGTVGVVVAPGDALAPGEPVRQAVAANIEELLREPLEVLVVLTTAGGGLGPLVEAIEQEAKARSWQPTCPVVAAHTWEYADENNSAIVSVLG